MDPVLFAGADVRVDPSRPDAAWDDARRRRYLLRPDVPRPLSIDTRVWPQPALGPGESLGYPLPWVGVEDMRRRWAAARAHHDGSVIVALGLLAGHGRPREAVVADRGIDSALVVGPRWRCLGYDVADGGTSGLSNCGFDDAEIAGLSPLWAPHLDEHGLFADPRRAIAFRALSDRRVPEHAPFDVYGLWLVE